LFFQAGNKTKIRQSIVLRRKEEGKEGVVI
jgi:hypothetical protein